MTEISSQFPLELRDRVANRYSGELGTIVKNVGIMTPQGSAGASWPPEQVWLVRYDNLRIYGEAKHWEGDLVLVEKGQKEHTL